VWSLGGLGPAAPKQKVPHIQSTVGVPHLVQCFRARTPDHSKGKMGLTGARVDFHRLLQNRGPPSFRARSGLNFSAHLILKTHAGQAHNFDFLEGGGFPFWFFL